MLEANEYAIAQEYINYRTKRDFERSQATDINFTINKLVNKDQAVVHENANKDSDLYNTQRDLTAGIVGKSVGLKCFLHMWRMLIKGGYPFPRFRLQSPTHL